jgi:hypothetical protein
MLNRAERRDLLLKDQTKHQVDHQQDPDSDANENAGAEFHVMPPV